MFLDKGEDFRAKIEEEHREVLRRARVARENLRKLESVLTETGLDALLEHYKSSLTGTSWSAYVQINAHDTEEDFALVKSIVTSDKAPGIMWEKVWGAEVKTVLNDNYERRERIVRNCRWEGEYEGVTFQIRFDPDHANPVYLHEGDELPSGCRIEVNVTANLNATAVACKFN
jgi:hypothetical protein